MKVLEISNVHSERIEKFLPFSNLAEFGYLIHLKNSNNCLSSFLTLTITTKATLTNFHQNEKL